MIQSAINSALGFAAKYKVGKSAVSSSSSLEQLTSEVSELKAQFANQQAQATQQSKAKIKKQSFRGKPRTRGTPILDKKTLTLAGGKKNGK